VAGAVAVLAVGIVPVGSGGLEGSPGVGDTATTDLAGAFIESPIDRGFEEDELSFHDPMKPRGCDILGSAGALPGRNVCSGG
jgi:hypothetical protein